MHDQGESYFFAERKGSMTLKNSLVDGKQTGNNVFENNMTSL